MKNPEKCSMSGLKHNTSNIIGKMSSEKVFLVMRVLEFFYANCIYTTIIDGNLPDY